MGQCCKTYGYEPRELSARPARSPRNKMAERGGQKRAMCRGSLAGRSACCDWTPPAADRWARAGTTVALADRSRGQCEQVWQSSQSDVGRKRPAEDKHELSPRQAPPLKRRASQG